MTQTVALIPVKPLAGALGRLTAVLGDAARVELQAAMLADVLDACAGARTITQTLVITGDERVAEIAAAAGAEAIADHRPRRGMNAAVARGQRAAVDRGAARAVVLTADLPLATAESLERLVGWAPWADAVLAPSRAGTGTNAMVLRPPGLLAPELGPDSLRRHLAQAVRRGARVSLASLTELALDIDTPDDLARLVGAESTRSRAGVLCRELGVEQWLAAAIFG